MNARIRILIADMASDEDQIAQIYDRLSIYAESPTDDQDVIVVGYYLHNLYTAFEHLSSLVAAAFENQIEDRSQWHALLLRRMAQPVEGIRPRLFSEQTYYCLNELRGFRHVFRSAYTVRLDPNRLRLVFEKAKELQTLYLQDLARFKAFLESL